MFGVGQGQLASEFYCREIQSLQTGSMPGGHADLSYSSSEIVMTSYSFSFQPTIPSTLCVFGSSWRLSV